MANKKPSEKNISLWVSKERKVYIYAKHILTYKDEMYRNFKKKHDKKNWKNC